MFGFRQSYNPVQTICFNKALQSPIAFQATVMVIGAAHLSVLQGFQGLDTDPRSVTQKARAFRLLNDGISDITEENCTAILFGVLSLASAEVRLPTFFHCVFLVMNFGHPVKAISASL
jgi:hypothetical protein